MCMILDSSQWGNFLRKKPDMDPAHNWIDRQSGKIITSKHPKIQQEQEPLIKKWQAQRKRAGREDSILWIAERKVEDAQNQKLKEILQKSKQSLKSKNDPHILALALASGAKLLATLDQDLIKDWTNKKIIGGKIYKKQKKRSQTEKILKNACREKS